MYVCIPNSLINLRKINPYFGIRCFNSFKVSIQVSITIQEESENEMPNKNKVLVLALDCVSYDIPYHVRMYT